MDKRLIYLGIILIIGYLYMNSGEVPKSNLLVTLTDPPYGSVNPFDTFKSIVVTIDRVTFIRSDGAEQVVLQQAKTYDLLRLKQSADKKVLSESQLPDGTYNHIRFRISSATATLQDDSVVSIKIPSNELKMKGEFVVLGGNLTAVNIDIDGLNSVHTGSGQYILTPVVSTEVRHGAQARINGDSAEVSGGRISAMTVE